VNKNGGLTTNTKPVKLKNIHPNLFPGISSPRNKKAKTYSQIV